MRTRFPAEGQVDLFHPGHEPSVASRPTGQARPARRQTRRVTQTQLDSHARVVRSNKLTGKTLIVHNEIVGNWKRGRTRQELADRTGIKLQTVCGIVNRLLHEGRVFEPTVGYGDGGRPVKWQRDGRAVVVDALYHDTWDLSSATQRVA